MKNILIIGASSGIGLALAKLALPHAHVYSASRNAPELEGSNHHYIPLDILQPVTDALQQLPDELHGVVYCPGSINLKPFNRLTNADFESDFAVNVLGAVNVLQAVLPKLKRANGAGVVLFSTVAAKVGMSFHASVAASKSAVEGLAKSLAAEWAAQKIRVNVIAPSLTDTPLAASLLSTPEKREASTKRHPLQQIGMAEEMAALAWFLVNDQSSFITGQVLGVDGGLGTLR